MNIGEESLLVTQIRLSVGHVMLPRTRLSIRISAAVFPISHLLQRALVRRGRKPFDWLRFTRWDTRRYSLPYFHQ